MDRNIFPDNPIQGDIACVIFGLAGTILIMALQHPLSAFSRNLHQTSHWLTRRIYEDFIYVIIFLFITPLWRGTWNLNTRYFLPELPIGGWVNHCIGLVLMVATQTLSNVGCFSGLVKDGVEENGGAFFPIKYLGIYFKDWYHEVSITCPW